MILISYGTNDPEDCNPENTIKNINNYTKKFFCDIQCLGSYPKYKLLEFERNGITIEMNERYRGNEKTVWLHLCRYYDNGNGIDKELRKEYYNYEHKFNMFIEALDCYIDL